MAANSAARRLKLATELIPTISRTLQEDLADLIRAQLRQKENRRKTEENSDRFLKLNKLSIPNQDAGTELGNLNPAQHKPRKVSDTPDTGRPQRKAIIGPKERVQGRHPKTPNQSESFSR